LEFDDGTMCCVWRAIVGFTDAQLSFPLLGQTGCLEFFNYVGRGKDRVSILEPISPFPGTIS